MKLKRTIKVDVPIGLWLVRFIPVWNSPCNAGEHEEWEQK